MTKIQIIAAVKELAHNASFSPTERQAALQDIEYAAQEEREKLEERYDD